MDLRRGDDKVVEELNAKNSALTAEISELQQSLQQTKAALYDEAGARKLLQKWASLVCFVIRRSVHAILLNVLHCLFGEQGCMGSEESGSGTQI